MHQSDRMKQNFSRLWQHIAPRRRKQFILLLLLMIAASFAEIVSIGAVLPFLAVLTNPERLYEHAMVQPLIQILSLTEARQLIMPLTIAFSFAALFSGAMRLILLWAQIRLSQAVGADLGINIYRRTLYQPYTVHAARNSGEVVAGISHKANEVVHLTILPVLIVISSCFMMVAIIAMLFTIQPFIAILAFSGFGVIYLAIIGLTKRQLAANSQRAAHEQNQVMRALQEGLGGIRDVLIDGSQEIYCKIFRDADIPLRRARANVQIISGSPRFGIEALGMVLIAMLAYSLAGDASKFASAVPVLGALALGAQRLLPALQQSYANLTLIRGGQVQLSDALELLDQPMPEHIAEPSSKPILFHHDIVMDKMAFRYSPEAPWVLQDFELSISKGGRVGFIGTTGSGKSTLLDIIMGLLQPTEGRLLVDGQAITQANVRSWQLHIAHVPQAIFLADTSIAENIALGSSVEKIDHARVHEAARKAQIAETIEAMDLGYETRVGERGVRLSGGQRQRIGIARALYKQADVIVFDEATSALDVETEGAVMDAIENISDEITVLIVAHRLSTLKGCDQVVELGNGSITRVGTYEEIVQG